MQASTTPVNRNEYGALKQMPPELHSIAQELLSQAISAKKLTAPYNDMKRHSRHGYLGRCLNYDYYDVTESSVLIQQRETERTKYGFSPRKNYFIIRRCGRGVTVIEAPKPTVVKLAKISTGFGQVIQTITGKAKNPLKLASASTKTKAT